jgi:hypothetical protein
LKLWKLTQTSNGGYDTFDSCVVAAETEQEAKKIRPDRKTWLDNWARCWADSPNKVRAEYIGETDRIFPDPIICSSFNAG